MESGSSSSRQDCFPQKPFSKLEWLIIAALDQSPGDQHDLSESQDADNEWDPREETARETEVDQLGTKYKATYIHKMCLGEDESRGRMEEGLGTTQPEQGRRRTGVEIGNNGRIEARLPMITSDSSTAERPKLVNTAQASQGSGASGLPSADVANLKRDRGGWRSSSGPDQAQKIRRRQR